jgi:uncharacterized protein YlxP (DUF503 family)
LKIAIYGVSRSGKDYLIKCLIKYLSHNSSISACHIEGSSSLNLLSNEKYNCSFKNLSESDKTTIRQEFTGLVNDMELEHQLVVVDAHYSFIVDDTYQVVLTEQDKEVYDAFFYLDTPSNLIAKYSRASLGEKKNLTITEIDISDWKSFEKIGLSTVCETLEKELIILDEDTQSCISFIEYFISNYEQKYAIKSIAKKLVNTFFDEIGSKQEVIIFDCDKTVSKNDVTYDFCRSMGIPSNTLKKIFHNDRYTSYQFFKIQNIYASKDIKVNNKSALDALDKVILCDDILQLINNSSDSYILGLTSGIYEIWTLVSKKYKLFDNLLGNSCTGDYFVTPSLKKQIVLELQSRKKTVTAIGDSMIDIPMLEAANKGYIIAHQKLNQAVASYFLRINQTSIQKFINSTYCYDISNMDIT